MAKRPKKTEEQKRAQQIRNLLRRLWCRDPRKHKFKMNNRKRVEGKRHLYEYQCNHCKEWFPDKQVQVDHIIPCGSFLTKTGKVSKVKFGLFCYILFFGEIQILCTTCHTVKTNEEK